MIAYNIASYKIAAVRHKLALAIGSTFALLWFSFRGLGLTATELGLSNSWLSLAYGAGAILAFTLGLGLAYKLPFLHDFFEDARAKDLSMRRLARKTLVEIPLITVVLEEILFRGLLLGWLLTQYSTITAVILCSVVFGLWHVLPGIQFSKENKKAGAVIPTILSTVLVTGISGITFCALRIMSGSIIAPMMLHYATNSGGFVASWLKTNKPSKKKPA